jgi:hypothetical protein
MFITYPSLTSTHTSNSSAYQEEGPCTNNQLPPCTTWEDPQVGAPLMMHRLNRLVVTSVDYVLLLEASNSLCGHALSVQWDAV